MLCCPEYTDNPPGLFEYSQATYSRLDPTGK